MSRLRRSFGLLTIGLTFVVLTFVVSGPLCAQRSGSKVVQRAKPPQFNSGLASSIFFDNAFQQALQGSRPADLSRMAVPLAGGAGGSASGGGGGAPAAATYPWSKIIGPTTLEDEVKSMKMQVDKHVTTPTEFAGKGYKFARREFSILTMLFAIAGEFDTQVRWKQEAPSVRDVFARSAANCKVGSQQAYKEASIRKQDLQDLIGGGAFQSASGKEAEPQAKWDQLVDRSPLMQRIEEAQQRKLQPWTSNKKDFQENVEDILHEAQIVAAIATVLGKEGMPDAADGDYHGYADKMKAAALEIVDAVKLNNDGQARKAVGAIGQACSQCHESYR